MKNIIKFIVFIIYTISIFFLKDFRLLVILFSLNFILVCILKLDLRKMMHNLKILLPFIIFTILINVIFDSVLAGIIIGIRIIICYGATYIFSKTMTVMEISNTLQALCYPLKIFKINTENIGIMVSISICMIPVLKNEMNSLINSMKSKGKLIKISGIIVIMKPLLISVLRRTNQIEKTLIAKAYESE